MERIYSPETSSPIVTNASNLYGESSPYLETKIRVETNMEIPYFDNFKKYMDTSQGASLLSMIMVNPALKGLEIKLHILDNEILYASYIKLLPAVWRTYKSEKSIIRNYKYMGNWTNLYGAFDGGARAYKEIESDTQYGDAKNIIDIEETNNSFRCVITKWNEPLKKKLIITLEN